MTKKRAERLTGYEIRLRGHRGKLVYGAFDGDILIAQSTALIEEVALRSLVHQVYYIHARKALDLYGWRCSRCRASRRLQIHHRKYRSHGGTHKIDNLEPVCWDCHKKIHRLERSK